MERGVERQVLGREAAQESRSIAIPLPGDQVSLTIAAAAPMRIQSGSSGPASRLVSGGIGGWQSGPSNSDWVNQIAA